MKKLILKKIMVVLLAIMSSLDAFSACQASFSKTITGLTVDFQNTSTYDYTPHYYWVFGDGTFSTAKDPIKTYASAGYKSVRLFVSDSSGSSLMCTSSVLDTIVLVSSQQTCSANFTKSISGLTVNLTNTSLNGNGTTAGLAYYWYFNEGPQSFAKNPSRTFTAYGVKDIRLIIFDSVTNCTASKTDSFMIVPGNPACNAAFVYSIYDLVVSFTNLSMTSSGSAQHSFLWNFSDGTTSTLKHPIKTFATGGVKIARLSIYDSATSCNSSFTDTLLLSTTGTRCRAGFTKTVIGLTANLTNTSLNGNGTTAGLAYYWTFNDSPNSNDKNPIVNFSSYGNKSIRLMIYDSITNCTAANLDTFWLAQSTTCQANFTKFISGLSVTLGNSSTNTNGLPAGLSYYWDFGDGTTSTQKDPVKTYASGGSKIIQLTISDSLQACFATKYDSIFLVAPTPLCSASFTMAIDTTTPFNFFLLNTSLVRPNSTYLWNFGDGNSSTSITPTHTYANFGSYLVCLTVSDSLCTSMFCDSVGMDSTGILLKGGAFGFQTLDFTTKAVPNGIAQEFGLNQYAIYPNPSNAIFNVEVDVKSASPITFQVTDISGKILFTKSVLATAGKQIEAIDLSDVHASIYFLSIFSNEGISTHKIIKN